MRSTLNALRHRLSKGPVEYLRWSVLIDARSLATFRIAVAVLIVTDVLLRSRNFHRFYTDDGVVPRHLAERYASGDAFSLFFFTDDPTTIAALFALHAIVGVSLLVGYRTTIATIVSFLFVVSLDHRNPLVLSYADILFRLLLFWAMFLPLGERWSIDALQADDGRRDVIVSLATAAILLQMVLMYFVNWLHKLPSERWRTGSAAVYVFGIDEITYLLGDVMRASPTLLQFGGLLWFTLLMLSPLLLVVHQRRRMMFTFLLMGGHLSFALTVRIGAFAFAAIAGLVLFLQPAFWDHARATVTVLGPGTDPVGAVYDVVRRGGIRLAAALPSARPPLPGNAELRHKAFVVVTLVVVITGLLLPATTYAADGLGLASNPAPVDNEGAAVLATFGVSQPAWDIFAGPGPRSTDRWFVFPARTSDGTVIDIYNDREMSWERPGKQLQQQHDTYRDRFYMTQIRSGGQGGSAARALAEYLCETWPRTHGVELTQINMWEVSEEITPETIDRPADRQRQFEPIHRHGCGNHDPGFVAPPPQYGQ